MANAKKDGNFIPSLTAVSNADGLTPILLWADPTTHRLLTSSVATVNLATEQLTGTTSGNNTTLDLTGLANAFTSIILVIRNGLVQAPTENWTRVGNIITVTNADAGSTYLITYSY